MISTDLSDADFRNIAEMIPQLVWACDPDGTNIFWNRRAEDYFGVQVAQILGWGWRDLLHPDDLEETARRWGRAIATGEPYEIDYRFRVADGSYRWNLARGLPIRNADGTIRRWAGTCTDIHAQKTAEAAWRASDERYRSFVANSSEAIWRIDLEVPLPVDWPQERQIEHLYTHARLTECNEATARLHGFSSPSEMQGLRLADMLPREEPRNMAYLRAAAGNGYRVTDVESIEMDRHGHPLYLSNSFVAEVRDGFILGAWGTSRNITERKKAELALVESEERFRRIADAAPVFIWMSGLDRGCTFCNEGWLGFTGRTMEQELGNGWVVSVHPEDLARCLEIYEGSFARREAFQMDFRLRHYSGIYRWITGRGLPAFYGPDGAFSGYIGACVDIHEQRLAKDEAVRANRAKDDFLAALSHELRTPLTPVLMVSQELEADHELSEEKRQQISLVRRNIQLEARLIDDLLDLTRIAHGKLQLRLEAVDVHALIKHGMDLVQGECTRRGIELRTSLKAESSYLRGDGARLQQVILNLLNNAIKFSTDGGVVEIRTVTREEELLVVEVIDQGVGIGAPNLETIFDAFDQGGLPERHRFGGLGLGLAISKAIVEVHGGTIEARSAGPGKGSTFAVTLEASRAQAQPAEPIRATPPRSRHLRILLVEDHEETREVLDRLLKRDGHEVHAAGSCAETRQLLDKQVFDLVISDLGLPDGSGHDVLRDAASRTPVPGIAISGYGMESDLEKSKAAGFAAHLIKPVQWEDLRGAILSATT